jgi:hypothetical protein
MSYRAIPYLPLNPNINRGSALIGTGIVLFSDNSNPPVLKSFTQNNRLQRNLSAFKTLH